MCKKLDHVSHGQHLSIQWVAAEVIEWSAAPFGDGSSDFIHVVRIELQLRREPIRRLHRKAGEEDTFLVNRTDDPSVDVSAIKGACETAEGHLRALPRDVPLTPFFFPTDKPDDESENQCARIEPTQADVAGDKQGCDEPASDARRFDCMHPG